MKKRYVLGICWLSVCCVWGAAVEKPNVVIFYADDFGWGDVQLHNPDPAAFRYTPNLDRMFSEGIEFSNYITHCVCSPSRAGLLTGKHYARVDQGPYTGGTLPHDLPNFAHDFKAAGYATGAFGKWHNGMPNKPEDGNFAIVDFNKESTYSEVHSDQTMDYNNNIFEKHKNYSWGTGVNSYGFDRWVGYYGGGGDFFDHYNDWHHDADWWHDRKYRADERGYRTDLITKHALQFIEDHRSGPFLCYIPHEATHNPIQLKQSDLKEFCRKLDSERGIRGQWEFVKSFKSPKTGKRIEDVQQLRFGKKEEFDLDAIDPEQTHFEPLIYAAFVYTLDKSIGTVTQKIEDLGLMANTVFVFASDNGATPFGINQPFQGGKHSLWEGGTHVPAAIWWPGQLDCRTAPYAPGDNRYTGLISYLDIYPTLMSLTRQPIQGTGLDGIDCSEHLRNRTECRPNASEPLFMMWTNYGALRTGRWKLIYSESDNRVELYDLSADVAESNNVAADFPEIRDQLVRQYKDWLTENGFTVPYVKIDAADIQFPAPAPEGDVLEIKAVQTGKIKRRDSGGLNIRFSKGRDTWDATSLFVGGGDRLEFDIYVHPDSEITSGCFYSPGKGWKPVYGTRSGLNQDGVLLPNLNLPKGVWTRQVVGLGASPSTLMVNHIVLNSAVSGTYHYSLDNIVVRKKDGTIRNVIWDSDADTINLLYRYKNKNYEDWAKVQAVDGFPFREVELKTVSLPK